MNQEYTILEVGKRHPIFKPDNPEGGWFDYDKAGARITIALDGPTLKEIEAVSKGSFIFYLAKIGGVIYVVVDFEVNLTFEMPYSIHLVSPEDRQIPEGPEEWHGIGIQVCLLDSPTGIIFALRYVGTAPEFTIAFRRYLEEQLLEPFSKEKYYTEVSEITSKYSVKDIMRGAPYRYKVGESK